MGVFAPGCITLPTMPYLRSRLAAVAGVLLAMLLNARIRGVSVFRTIFYLPSIMPVVVMAITWLWMFDPINGVVNYLLDMVGIPGPPGWAARSGQNQR